ncbi:MAG: response regulator [Rhizobacter sp.]
MGAAWGGAYFVAQQHAFVQPYLALGSLLVVTSLIHLHTPYRPSIVWAVVPCAVLTALQQATFGRALDVGVAMAYLLAVGLLLRLAWVQNTLMTQVMLASEERLGLLNELEQQRWAAQQANEAKTRFLASVSHDLRQPMHSMALLTDALSRGPTDQLGIVQQLSKSVEGMNDLLHGLSHLPGSNVGQPASPGSVDGNTRPSAVRCMSMQNTLGNPQPTRPTNSPWPRLFKGLRQVVFDLLSPWRNLPTLSMSLNTTPIDRRIAQSQFRAFYETTLEGSTRALLITTSGAIALFLFYPGWLPGIWGACGALLVASAWLDGRRYRREKPADEALRPWEVGQGRRSILQGFLVGSVWLVWPDAAKGDGAPTPYIAMALLLVIVVSLRLKTSYRPALSWFALPCMARTTFSLMTSGPAYHAIHGLAFFAVVVFMIRWGWMQNTLTTQSMQVAEERVQLLTELESQRAAAQHAHEVKSRFLSSVGQDLNAPMQTIAALTRSLRLHTGDETDLLVQIRASVHAMDDMLAALLEVSQLDDGTLPLNVETLALDPLLKRVELQFAAQALSKGLELRVLPCGAQVSSDSFQLRRIVDNLVANAIRYTHNGRVLVRCRVRTNLLWLQVWDSGLGIARHDRQRIFEEFVQIADTQRTSAQGLGLGLSIVRRLAQRLHHPLRLHSRPGRGSLFALGIPLVHPHTHRTPSQANHEARLLQLLSGQLVLLIDDDETVLKSMQVFLRAFQCEVLVAHSTASALQVVDGCLRTPDLLISDFQLGDADNGAQAITAVRALIDEDVPALLITANVGPARAAARSLGIDVLAKPLQVQKLVQTLQAGMRTVAS